MPVPTNLSDLSVTPASNSPASTDTLSTTDDYLRAQAAILAKISAGTNALVTPALGTPASGVLTNCTGTATGLTVGTATNATNVAVTDAAGGAATWVMLAGAQTGNTGALSDAGLTYNATTNALTATTFVGALTGTASGNYTPSGTDVALADGGTGASLTDPNADRIMFWDDSAGAVTWLTAGTGLSITDTTISASGGSSTITRSAKTGVYTVVAGDNGTVIDCTSGTFSVNLTAAATLGDGFNVWIINSGTGTITIDPNGSETVDNTGVGTLLTLKEGAGYRLLCNGTGWQTIAVRGAGNNVGGGVQFGWGAAAGGSAVALGSGATASGTQSIAIGFGTSAAAAQSVAIGRNSAAQSAVTATNAGAMALGGSYASGTDSVAAAIANNTSTYGAKNTGAIAIGALCNATGTYDVAIGNTCTASGGAAIAIGDTCTASGANAMALGSRAVATQAGKYTYGSGRFTADGDAQFLRFVLRRAVAAGASGTSLVVTSTGAAPGTTNQLVLPTTGMAVTATVLLIGKQTVATKTAAYTSTFTVVNTAGTLTLQGGTWTAVGTASIDATFTAPPTIAVSGTEVRISTGVSSAAATNWVAVVQAAEILF